MAKIVVAFSDRELNRQISTLLEGAGFDVFRCCITGNDVMRAFNQCRDGVLLCGTRFADRTLDQLAWDLESRVLILAVGRPDALALCEHPDVYKLALPAARNALTAAVDMLVQMHYKRMPRRPEAEKQEIEKAKQMLMDGKGLSEAEAHRALQHYSMRNGVKMVESARRVLSGEFEE